jgi:thiamine kinase-like enzyme
MADINNMKNLKLIGHSGCKLEIKELGGKLVVVKTSKNKDYNQRLKKQHEKQKSSKIGSFFTPRVLESRHNENGLFEFSMEYVSGLTLAEYFKKVEISSIKHVAEFFLNLIPKKYSFDPAAKQIFLAKIGELEKKIDVSKDDALKKSFRLLKNYHWRYCSVGDCHGDMALENIIRKDGNLYLIDFLDSFYDSWMIDLSKLLLDIECLWSYRNDGQADENLKIRLLIFKNLILDKLASLKEGRQLVVALYYMILIHLIRILPYAEDRQTKKFLMDGVSKVNNIINSL